MIISHYFCTGFGFDISDRKIPRVFPENSKLVPSLGSLNVSNKSRKGEELSKLLDRALQVGKFKPWPLIGRKFCYGGQDDLLSKCQSEIVLQILIQTEINSVPSFCEIKLQEHPRCLLILDKVFSDFDLQACPVFLRCVDFRVGSGNRTST